MTTTQPTTPDRETRVLDLGALRALSHPLRIRILDLLTQTGPQTASSLGEMVGESSGVTSYHLRALAKHDLIREVSGRGTARERWWERPRGSMTMDSTASHRTPAGRAASQLVVMEWYRQRNDQLMRYLESAPADEDAVLSTATTRLTLEQFAELGRELDAVVNRAVERYRDQDGENVRPYSIRLDVIPVDGPARTGREGRP